MPPSLDEKQNHSRVWGRHYYYVGNDRPSAETQQATSISQRMMPTELQKHYAKLTQIARSTIVVCVIIAVLYRHEIQSSLDNLWVYVRNEAWFQSAYFETVYVTVVYALLIVFYPFLIHHLPFLQRYKVSEEVHYVHKTVLGITKDVVVHASPLLVADMLIIKRYPNVPYSEIAARKQDWIVTTRPLPEASPGIFALCLHVAGSVLLFDLFFTAIHYSMHRNAFLYKYFHSQHHTHEIVHAHVTNQLSVVERGLQIISANYALKAFGSHPITRLVFVPVFLWLLIENHTGYDFPWAPHRILPRGSMGGPVKHYIHHTQGHGNYQPFFTYLDDWIKKRKQISVVTKIK